MFGYYNIYCNIILQMLRLEFNYFYYGFRINTMQNSPEINAVGYNSITAQIRHFELFSTNIYDFLLKSRSQTGLRQKLNNICQMA